MPEVLYFTDKESLHAWFTANHLLHLEFWLGYFKTGSGQPSVTWPESVEVAICFGWIDAVRYTIDEHRYKIRFTRRRPGSNWSAINIAKAEKLILEGLMQPEGLAAFELRVAHKSAIYSYENSPRNLDAEQEQLFREQASAWAFFTAQAPSYQRTAIYWVQSAKQTATRQRRLQTLISDSAAGKKIALLSYGKGSSKK